MPSLTDAKRRIVERLKRTDAATAPELAAAFALTDTAIRQHLEVLEAAGIVERAPSPPKGRGRPPVRWQLTPLARDLFPDRHGELTVELLNGVRDEFGEEGLERVLATRAVAQETAYRSAVRGDVITRVQALARVRSDEGYLAEAVPQPDGSVLLVEHHCPVADAAHACVGLCRTELDVFRRVLGTDVTVDRAAHLLAGDQRCAYLVRPSD